MSTTVKNIADVIEAFAPKEQVCPNSYDNIGLLVGDYSASVTKALVCLDATAAVIDEAIEIGANLIISHHPIIFGGLQSITNSDSLGKKVIKAIKNGINIYAAHTNLDFCIGGINEFVAIVLGFKNLKILEQFGSGGLGRIGELEKPKDVEKFAKEVSTILQDNNIRTISASLVGAARSRPHLIKKSLIINGSGGGDTKYIDAALAHNCDCLITAEVKHHMALYAIENGLTIIEPTHHSSEKIYLPYFTNLLSKKQPQVQFIQSQAEQNPYK